MSSTVFIEPGTVRPMALPDLELVLSWRNYPDIRACMFDQREITLEDHSAWFKRVSQDKGQHPLIFEQNQKPLGFVCFKETGDQGIAEWSFHAAPDAPRGTGQLLGSAALNHAFSVLKLHKVYGQVIEYNQPSIKMHERLKFSREGVLRDHYVSAQGYHAIICFGLLSSEW